MAKYITEVLKEINDNPELIAKHMANAGLRIVYEYAYDPAKKFILPEGVPPYKKDEAPIGMTPGNVHQEFRRFYVFCRADLPALRRESIFISLLENIHPSEVDMMLAIKDQDLTRLYPNLTRELGERAGFIQPLPVVEVAPEPDKVVKVKAPRKAAAKKA